MTNESYPSQIPNEALPLAPLKGSIELQMHNQTLEIGGAQQLQALQSGSELDIAPGVEMPDMNNLQLMAEVELFPGFEQGAPRVAIFKNEKPDDTYGDTLISIVQVNKYSGKKTVLSGILNRKDKDQDPDLTTPEGGVKFGRKLFTALGPSYSTEQWRDGVSSGHLVVTPIEHGFGAAITDMSKNGSSLHKALGSEGNSETHITGETTKELGDIAVSESVIEDDKLQIKEAYFRELEAQMRALKDGFSEEDQHLLWKYSSNMLNKREAQKLDHRGFESETYGHEAGKALKTMSPAAHEVAETYMRMMDRLSKLRSS